LLSEWTLNAGYERVSCSVTFCKILGLIGTKFVLKRRIITQNQIFIDQFIRSNGICCQLMEYEGKDINNDILPCFSNIIDVTNNLAYYNENMCTEFTQQDFEHFIFLNHLLKR